MTEPSAPALLVVRPNEVPVAHADALLDGAVVARADARVADVAGPGAVACVQGLLTNDLDAPGEGSFVYGAVLTPKGMIVTDLWAARAGSTVTVTYPSTGRDPLFEIFQRSLPPRLARVTDRGIERAVLRLAGPAALGTAEKAGLALPAAGRAARSAFRPSDCQVARPPLSEPFALQLHVALDEVQMVTAALEQAGAVPAGPAVLELARIMAGWPRLGAEIDQKTLPQEVRYDEINGVSYTKGCYTGQETVSRLHFRGHTNRRLVGLVWQDGPDVGRPEIAQQGKSIGRLSSVAWLAPLAQHVGLGLVRRDMDPALPVLAGGAPARVVDLPMHLTG